MDTRADFNQISRHAGPSHSPGFLLWHVSTSWRSALEAVLRPLELTHPQFVVLATSGWLTREGAAATQTMIAKMAGLDPNTLSQVLRGLEARQLVSRARASDGRAKQVALTAAGARLLSRALPAVEQADADFFGPLTPAEQRRLLALFAKMTAAVDHP